MSIGTVISTQDSPNTTKFSFVISGDVKKNMYVKVNNVIAVVEEIYTFNPYYEHADSVSYYEKEKSLSQIYPTTESEFKVADALIMGEIKGDRVERVIFPVNPGENVEIADNQSISKILGLDDKGLWLGNINTHNLKVKINMNRLLKKHLAILAISGAGKSYFVSVILEELMKRKTMLPIILIDVHGEYSKVFKSLPKEFNGKVKVIQNIKIGFKNVDPMMLAHWMSLTGIQTREISSQLAKIEKEVQGAYDIDLVIEKVKESNISTNTKNSLIKWLEYLKTFGMFGKVDSINIHELVKPGQLSIIDLREIDSLTIKQIIVSYYARRMFNKRKKDELPPFSLIIEEAHNFASQAKEDKNISKSILQTIAREGRKFGASLVVISQRPVQLDTTVLSQCNSHAILRVTNPNDIKHIQESSEGFTTQMAKDIPGLAVGEVFLTGEAVNKPVLFKVRKRIIDTSEKDKTLDDMLKEWMGKGDKVDNVSTFI